MRGPDPPPMKYTSSRKMVGMDRSMGTSEPVRAKKNALSLQQHPPLYRQGCCRPHRCALCSGPAHKPLRQVLEASLRMLWEQLAALSGQRSTHQYAKHVPWLT